MEKELTHIESLLVYTPTTSFTVISRGRVTAISFEDITHITRRGFTCMIHTTTNEVSTRASLAEMLNDLPVNEFCRANKSQIISLKHLSNLSKNKV